MGALCAAIAIVAVVLPHAGGLGLLGTVPMGLLAYRYRIRVVITATVAAGVIGFLVVGLSGLGAVALCAYVGGLQDRRIFAFSRSSVGSPCARVFRH